MAAGHHYAVGGPSSPSLAVDTILALMLGGVGVLGSKLSGPSMVSKPTQ